MSGYIGEAETIRGWFLAEWDSGVPIHVYENTKFTDKPDDAIWARLRVLSRDAYPAAIGGPTIRYRHDGDIILEIFAPESTGDGAARSLADDACAIMRGREDGGIVVWTARAIPLGVRDGWYRINVVGSFSRDEDFALQS